MASPTPNLSFIGIVDFSEKARWLFMTESVTELLGYEPHELIGRPSLELVHPDEFPRVKQLHYDTIQQDKAAVLVYLRMRHKDTARGYVLCGVSRTVVHNVLVGSVSFASPGKALHNASTAQEITVITPSAANFEFRRWHDPSPMPPSPIPSEMMLPLSPAPSSGSATSATSWDSRENERYYSRTRDYEHDRDREYYLDRDRYSPPPSRHHNARTRSPPSSLSHSPRSRSNSGSNASAERLPRLWERTTDDRDRDEEDFADDDIGSRSPVHRRFPDSAVRGLVRARSGSASERLDATSEADERETENYRDRDRDREVVRERRASDAEEADNIPDRRTPAPASDHSPVLTSMGTPSGSNARRYSAAGSPTTSPYTRSPGPASRYMPPPPPIISFAPLPSKSFRTAFILDRFSSQCTVLYASNDLLLSASSALGRSFFDFVRVQDEEVVRGWIECVKGWGVNEFGQPSDGGFGFGKFGLISGGRDSGSRMPDPLTAPRNKHRRPSQSGRGSRPAKYTSARDGAVPPLPTRGTAAASRGAANGHGVNGSTNTNIARRAPSHRETPSVGDEGDRFNVDAIFSAHSDGLMVILRRA